MANCEVKPIQRSITSIFPDASKRQRYSNLMTSYVGSVFKKFLAYEDYSVGDISKKEVIDDIYSKVGDLMNNVLSLSDGYEVEDLPLGVTKDNLPPQEVLDDIETILNNFNAFSNYHQATTTLFKMTGYKFNENLKANDEDNSTITESAEDIVSDNELSEEERSVKMDEYDRTINDSDSYDQMHKDVKFVFNILDSSVYNIENDSYDIQFDANNLPILAPANNIYNRLISRLNDVKDEYELLNALSDESLWKVIPEVRQINDILNLDAWGTIDERSYKQKELWSKFYDTFSKPFVNNETLVTGKNAIGNNSYLKVSDIKGNSNAIRSQWINNFESKIFESSTSLTYSQGTDSVTINRSAVKIGDLIEPVNENQAFKMLEQLGITLSRANFETRKEESDVFNTAKQIHTAFMNLRPDVITAPIQTLSNMRKGYLIQKLLLIEGKYSTLAPTMSVLNAAGERQYSIANETNISLTNHYLNNSNNLSELIQNSPFLNISYNPLFGKSLILRKLFPNGKRNKNFSFSFNIISGNRIGKKGKMMRNYTDRDKVIHDFNSMLKYGRTDIMRPETSNTFFSLGLQQKSTVDLNENIDSHYFSIDEYKNGLLESPLVRQQLMDYLQAEKERVLSYDQKKVENPTLPISYSRFKIFAFLENEPDLRNDILNNDISDGNLGRFFDEYEKILEKKLAESERQMVGIDQSELIDKDLIEKYPDVDQLKRAYLMNSLFQNIEFGILFSGDPLFFPKDFHKRAKALSSTGQYTNVTDTINYLVNNNDRLNNFNISSLLGVELRDNSVSINTRTVKDILSDPKDFFYKDEKYEVSDGQGIVSIDYLHELSIRQGWGNEFTGDVFEYEYLVMKRDILKQELTTNEEDKYKRLQSKIEANPDIYALPVMKAGYYGPILNSTVDGRAYDKFSLMPMLPSYAVGKENLEQLIKDLALGQYSYIKFKTGTKGFARESVDITDLNTGQPDEYATQLFKLQISYGNEQSIDTSIPTQLLKLVYSNTFDDGKEKIAGIKTLYDQYINTLGDIQKDRQADLLRSFGIDENGIVDYSIFSEKLLREAVARGMNSNVLHALTINPTTKKFNTSIEATIASEVEKLITSITDKTLRRFKVNGGDFVLISNALSPKLKFYQKDSSGVSKAEGRISMSKEFSKLLKLTHPDGKVIGTRNRLNEAIKNKKWNRQYENSLTIVLDRVPTQELNSMDVVKIVEFLPSSMGNVVQLPNEAVVKAGFDFDYDKEKVIIPSFSRNGSYQISAEEAQNEIDKLRKERKAKILQIKDTDNQGETVSKIREYIKDIAKNINSGNFNYIKENKDSIKLKELFNQVANLEIARAYLEQQIDPLINSESQFSFIPTEQEEYAIIDELEQLRLEIDSLSDEFDTQLKSFKKDLLFDTINEGYGYKNRIADLAEMTFNKLGNYSNSVLSNYANNLLNPDRFDNLTRKNDVSDIKALAKSTAEHIGVSTDMPIDDNVFYPSDNIRVFSTFFNAKNMLAPYAKTNTMQQVMAYAGTKVNKSANVGTWKEVHLNHILITPEEAAQIETEDQLDFGKNYDLNGREKQMWNSQSINATVDAAKDPYFRSLMLTYKNIGVEILMSSFLGYPKDRVIAFLTNKGLLDIVDKMNNGMSPAEVRKYVTNKYDFGFLETESVSPAESQQRLVEIRNRGLQPTIKFNQDTKMFDISYKVDGSFYDTVRQLDATSKYIDKATLLRMSDKNFNLEDESDEVKDLQNRIIAHFYNMLSYNYTVSNITRYLNFDTSKVGSLMELKKRQTLRQEILNSGIISKEELDKLDTDSIIGKFKNDDNLDFLFKKFMPIINKMAPQLDQIYEAYDKNFREKSKARMRTLPKDIENDFLYYIIYNFGQKAKNGFEKLTRIGSQNDDYVELARRLSNFKKSKVYQQLIKNYPVLENLNVSVNFREVFPDKNPEIEMIQNVQFIKPNKLSLTEEESYIYQFRQLLTNPSIEEKVRNLITDIFDAGIAQSGLSKTFISFKDLIPIEYYQKDFEDALTAFNKLSDADKMSYTDDFIQAFRYNNPKYFQKNNRNSSSQLIKFYQADITTTSQQQQAMDKVAKRPSSTEMNEPISLPTYSKKKETIELLSGDSTFEGIGYKVKIEGHPNTNMYITKTINTSDGPIEGKQYYIVDLITSKMVVSGGKTIKDTLTYLQNTINNNISKMDILQSIGLFSKAGEFPDVNLNMGDNQCNS